MKKKFEKLCGKITRYSIPLCGLAASLCMFVAEHSQELCIFTWGYEICPPKCLSDRSSSSNNNL